MPPRSKASGSRSAGQATIASFFGGSSKKTKPESNSDNEEIPAAQSENEEPTTAVASDASDIEMSDTELAKKGKKVVKPAPTKKLANAPDASELPPINDIPAIFEDLVSHIPEIKDVAELVQGRKLRVATMCSGTESPLLALELIQQSIKNQHGITFGIQHVFSCEIEPFKEAYIERNFQPPVLFRDVCELGEAEAHTAYGALVPVPGDVDILVAGTSCVDYSNLNTQKQDIDANGESGRTFRGMMSWVRNHRPPLVILENVCSAPWPKVVGYFEDEGYSAEFTRVDTKHYYIPHTRTRVYLVAVNKRGSTIPAKWKDTVVNKLKRPASSTLDAFMLASDDPRIHVAREKLVAESYGAPDKKTGRTDWGRCESRHQRARLEEELGLKRPLTAWEEGGICKLLEWQWQNWGVGQVERVWDLMDISYLRSANKGIDPNYKTTVWNLSQNVDRTIGSNKVGICPCLTPSMIPYITNRGGPMVGLEALSMQGLPVDKLLLTRETEDQLADLAGNAMSTTVVGACILAALVCGKKLLKAGDDEESYESKFGLEEPTPEGDVNMDVDENSVAAVVQSEVSGEDKLIQKALDLSPAGQQTMSQLAERASLSARLCVCEGRVGMTKDPLWRCKDCDSTYCNKCGGRPEHNPDPCQGDRLHPIEFAKDIKAALPMSISICGVTDDVLSRLTKGKDVDSQLRSKWMAAVSRTKEHDLHFTETKRQETWSVLFDSPTAMLELYLQAQRPEWRLFAKPEVDEPANALIRVLLQSPVARMICNNDILSGTWEFAVPAPLDFSLTIEGTGELVPSWQARLGLNGKEFVDATVHSAIEVSVSEHDAKSLDRDISGKYTLLEKCGTANGALHKKLAGAEDDGLPPLYMLFDPHRTNDDEDCFVFSPTIRRLEYGETRPVVCKLDPSWRQSNKEGKQTVAAHLPWQWVQDSSVHMKGTVLRDATYGIPDGAVDFKMVHDACGSAHALLNCRLPLGPHAGAEWPKGDYVEIDKIHERSVFKKVAWLLEKTRHIGNHFSDWQSVSLPEGFDGKCERCAPSAPVLNWVYKAKKQIPIENPVQAGEYERRLKGRPTPFVSQLKLDVDGIGSIRIGINIPSLLHRALSCLPPRGRTSDPLLSWKLDTNYSPIAAITRPNFKLSSNKADEEHAQPPNFRLKLRKEQLRSLSWMMQQESESTPEFVEEEIAEAVLDPLGWRAEGRAQRRVKVLGGVLADEVGYGKTAITLGLIDCSQKKIKKSIAKAKPIPGKLHTQATLVIVPSHLVGQWAAETRKFLKKGTYNVLEVATLASLNKLTIEDIQEADVVIWSGTIHRSKDYAENLTQFAGVGDLPDKPSRFFNSHLQKTLEALRTQVDRLRDEGTEAVLKDIRNAEARVAAEEKAAADLVASKRLKGRSYREAVEKAQKAIKPKAEPTVVESDEEEDKKPVKVTKPKKTTNGTVKKEPSLVTSLTKGTAKANSAGLIPEVVLTVRKPSQPLVRSESENASDSDDDDGVKRRPRRSVAKRIVIEDLSADEEDEPAPKQVKAKGRAPAKAKAKAKGKPKKKGDEESDFKMSSDEESEDEVDSDQVDSDDAPTTKKKPVKKAIGRVKKVASVPPTSCSEAETDGDDMDVDEDVKPAPKTQSKKRKATDDGDRAPAKKKPKRAQTDPWKLGSTVCKKDWTQMQSPMIEMFHWARVVIDEYTYLDGRVLPMVQHLSSERTWVLSGTPPVHDFAAVKTIAAFLNLHLGIDDDGEGDGEEVKKRRRQLTTVERFHSFREVHTTHWHDHRLTVGQRFMDQFVRQNVAEIDQIPWEVKEVEVVLPAAERAIYLELEHHLRALDMTIKRGKKTESDREMRLNKALGDSKSAEEALLKRCSHFELETTNDNAMRACDVIVAERTTQLEECKAALLKAVKEGKKRENALDVPQESLFNEFVRICRTEGLDDEEATSTINDIFDKAGLGTPKQPKANKSDKPLKESLKQKVWEHREKTHEIRRLAKELTGRIRSLRYFTVVRDIQKHKEKRKPVECPSCNKEVPLSEVAVLSSCGHEGCIPCMKECADKEECVYTASGKCKSAARAVNIVCAETLGEDDEVRDGQGKHFGRKLEKVLELIQHKIPKEERVLLFVQFKDLMGKVREALDYHKIKYLEIAGGTVKESNALLAFQEGKGQERVLLQEVMNEKAAGSNLTCANHAIFLSPLLTPSHEIYTACETQAIGRLVRFGQTKPVTIWKFCSKDTIDEEIYQERAKVLARLKQM